MRKHFSLGLISGLLIGLFLSSAAVVMATTPIKLIVNGVDITYKSDVPPQIIDGRTLVPARALAEALGATVDWDSSNQAVVVSSNNNTKEVSDLIQGRELAEKYGVEITIPDPKIKEAILSFNEKEIKSPYIDIESGMFFKKDILKRLGIQ